MTRDALIKLLRDDHYVEFYPGLDGPEQGVYICAVGCGEEFDTYREWSAHVADLILLGFAT